MFSRTKLVKIFKNNAPFPYFYMYAMRFLFTVLHKNYIFLST